MKNKTLSKGKERVEQKIWEEISCWASLREHPWDDEGNELDEGAYRKEALRRAGRVDSAISELVQEAVKEERDKIEAVFIQHVPPHGLSLEDGVWLKRLLNKAFPPKDGGAGYCADLSPNKTKKKSK